MIKDLLGRTISRKVTHFEQEYMGKYYIYNNKVFRIMNIEKINKMDEPIVVFLTQDVITNKNWTHTLTLSGFLDKKFYTKKPKLDIDKKNYKTIYKFQ